jgi:hypothetical protein
MAKVWTTRGCECLRQVLNILSASKGSRQHNPYLPWIDEDQETTGFIDYWFGDKTKK